MFIADYHKIYSGFSTNHINDRYLIDCIISDAIKEGICRTGWRNQLIDACIFSYASCKHSVINLYSLTVT